MWAASISKKLGLHLLKDGAAAGEVDVVANPLATKKSTYGSPVSLLLGGLLLALVSVAVAAYR